MIQFIAQLILAMIIAAGGYGIAEYYTVTKSGEWWALFLGIVTVGNAAAMTLKYS